VLYFTLIRSRLEYASVVWNSVTSTDASKLEHIQQKFASVCFYRFSLMFPIVIQLRCVREITSTFSMYAETSPRYTFFQAYRGLKSCISFLENVVSLLAMLGTSQRLAFVPLTNTVLLLGAPMLQRGG
jgi:hypothetical protein